MFRTLRLRQIDFYGVVVEKYIETERGGGVNSLQFSLNCPSLLPV
jgi:hypothetical protein